MNKIKKLSPNVINMITGISAIACYFLLSKIAPYIFYFLGLDHLSNFGYFLSQIIYEFILLGIILAIFNKKIKNDLKDLKINYKKYFSENLKYYLLGLAVMFVSNAFIMFVLGKNVTTNESTIRSLLAVSPIYIYIVSVIIAPTLEELVFRHGIRTLIKNKYAYILISGIVFGGLHILTSLSGVSDLLYLIPYCSLGIAFAYIYYKTNNIFVTIGIHTMHNGILVGLQILVLLFS